MMQFEIVVVDNGSSPHIAHALAALLPEDDRVRLVRLPHNRNFSGGSNAGALAATGHRLVFLNNDTVVQPGWLQPLLEPLDDAQVIGTQAVLLYPDGSVQTAGTIFVDDHLLPCHLLARQPPTEGLARLEDWGFRAVTAACMAVRAREFYAIEGFDSTFRNGFEDVDLCMRLARATPTGAFHLATRSRVTHFESKSPGRYQHVDANRALFFERWHGEWDSGDLSVFDVLGYDVIEISTDGREVPAASVTARLRPRT